MGAEPAREGYPERVDPPASQGGGMKLLACCPQCGRWFEVADIWLENNFRCPEHLEPAIAVRKA